RPPLAEAPPPLDAHAPRVPHERRAGMDPHQEHRGLGNALPALDLHAEPVVHERIPQVLLPVHELVVRPVEGPLSGALGQPARGTRQPLAPSGYLAPGLLGVALGLPSPIALG